VARYARYTHIELIYAFADDPQHTLLPTMASGRGRGWCFTLNNYTEKELNDLRSKDFAYIIFGREVGASGTPHLQGYVHFKNTRLLKQVKAILGPRYHIERRMGSLSQAIDYCKKDGEYTEIGRKPLDQKEKGDLEKTRWATLYALAEKGDWDNIKTEFPKEAIIHGPRLMALHRPECKPIDGPLQHEWWVGPTGSGKSKLVWELYPKHYAKPLNKWWDGYQFENTVVIEEWAPRNECTASSLKIWADRYPFTCEVKGAVLPKIRPQKLIVLSNYTIAQCFPQKEDQDPLLRRFKVIKFPEDKPWARMYGPKPPYFPKPETALKLFGPTSLPKNPEILETPPQDLQPAVQNPLIEEALYGSENESSQEASFDSLGYIDTSDINWNWDPK